VPVVELACSENPSYLPVVALACSEDPPYCPRRCPA